MEFHEIAAVTSSVSQRRVACLAAEFKTDKQHAPSNIDWSLSHAARELMVRPQAVLNLLSFSSFMDCCDAHRAMKQVYDARFVSLMRSVGQRKARIWGITQVFGLADGWESR